jgi:hypothetical protein
MDYKAIKNRHLEYLLKIPVELDLKRAIPVGHVDTLVKCSDHMAIHIIEVPKFELGKTSQ